MTNIDAMQNILSNLKKKYSCFIEFETYTNGLLKAADANDTEKFGVTLNMRQRLMRKIDELDNENRKLVSVLPQNDKSIIAPILRPGQNINASFDNVLHADIFECQKKILSLVRKIIDADMKVNKIVNNNK